MGFWLPLSLYSVDRNAQIITTYWFSQHWSSYFHPSTTAPSRMNGQNEVTTCGCLCVTAAVYGIYPSGHPLLYSNGINCSDPTPVDAPTWTFLNQAT